MIILIVKFVIVSIKYVVVNCIVKFYSMHIILFCQFASFIVVKLIVQIHVMATMIFDK